MAVQSRAKRAKTPLETMITVAEICEALGISKRTFYEWKAKGRAPETHKMPNGELRVEPAEYERWLKSLKDAA